MQLDGRLLSRVEELVRGELAREADAGYPELGRVPSSGIIKLLDYLSELSPAQRDAFVNASARLGALQFFPAPLIAAMHEQLRTSEAAHVSFREAMQSPPFVHGFRYASLRMTRAELNDTESMAFIAQARATLDFTPHDDPPPQLVPDPDLRQVQTAKAPLLRKLLNKVVAPRVGAKAVKQPGGDIVYDGSIGSIPFKVRFSFSNLYAQMNYSVTSSMPQRGIFAQRLTYETLWGMNTGWDYLTEENAERSIELLDRLLVRLAELLEKSV